jgi:hypothetical protein
MLVVLGKENAPSLMAQPPAQLITRIAPVISTVFTNQATAVLEIFVTTALPGVVVMALVSNTPA